MLSIGVYFENHKSHNNIRMQTYNSSFFLMPAGVLGILAICYHHGESCKVLGPVTVLTMKEMACQMANKMRNDEKVSSNG